MHKPSFRRCCLPLFAFALLAFTSASLSSAYAQEQSIQSIKEEAQKGVSSAQYLLGMAYVQGSSGQKKDFTEAARWFRSAADQNNVEAAYHLGVMCALGEGMQQDYTQAAEWYKKAAEQGHVQAQHNLGLMYYEGQGVKQDYKEAARWLSSASTHMRDRLTAISTNAGK